MAVKFPQLFPPKLGAARVDFDPVQIRRFLIQHGLRMKWEQAARCPCSRKLTQLGETGDTYEMRTDCAECTGSGVIYFGAQEVIGFATDHNANPRLRTEYGEHADGMVRVTLAPEHRPSVLDRFTLLESSFIFDEIRTRSTSPTDKLRYPVYIREIEVGSALDCEVATAKDVGVVYARRADSTGALVAGELVEGTDFKVTADGEIDWALGDGLTTAPSVGDKYSMRYFARPVYVAQRFPYSVRDQRIPDEFGVVKPTALPTRVDCWLEHLGSRGLPLP